MAFSIVSGTRKRVPVGNRFMVTFVADEVNNTGSYVAKADIGLSTIDSAVAVDKEAATAIQCVANSQDGSTLTNYGDVYLKTASGTDDVQVVVIGR